MELKIVSTEIIKPSSPTPPHLYKLTLSLLDQKYKSFIVPVLLFYGPPHEAAPPLDIGRLKACLAKTLTFYYPLAGRVENVGSILCNDEGIPFVEARATCSMSSALELLSSRSNNVPGFFPPRVGLIEEGVQVSIQVTVFTCGGFCIGWYHTHKVTDGTSMGNFFRYWAVLFTRQNDNVFAESAAQDLADFSSAARLFPPVVLQEEKPVTPELNHEKKEIHDTGNKNKDPSPSSSFNFQFQNRILMRSFVINKEAVAKLKAISISDEVPNPSRFEAVAGFLWKSIILSSNPSKEGRSAINVAMDLRPRVDPPLSVGVMGNLFETMLVQSEKSAELHELVAKIHGTILKTKELALEYQGENREAAKNMHWRKFINAIIECKGKDLHVMTSWCKSAGFSDVDFGFGNPKRVIPVDDVVNHNQRNMIILTEFNGSDEGGFEAWLFLDEQIIKVLESSPEFHVFASPKF